MIIVSPLPPGDLDPFWNSIMDIENVMKLNDWGRIQIHVETKILNPVKYDVWQSIKNAVRDEKR